MNICYPILLGICLFCSGTIFAQDPAPPKRSKLPSWLPQPPERPARVPRELSTRQAYKRPKLLSWLPHPPERSDTVSHKPSIREAYKPKGLPNVLTANVPSLMFITMYPCVSLGMEYERFITKSGMFSVSLAAYWYTAYIYDKPQEGYMTTNFQGYQAIPAFLYHPLGNTRRGDISIGPCLALGRYREEIETRDASGLWHSSVTNIPFTAVLGQFNVTGHSLGSFVFGAHFSAGAVINGRGSDPGVIHCGMKFGRRF